MSFRYGQQKHPVKARQLTVVGGRIARSKDGVTVVINGGAISELKMKLYLPCRYTRCQIFSGTPDDKTKRKPLADARVFCFPEDIFDKNEGRRRALTAALADTSKFNKAARTAAWTAYNERGSLAIDVDLDEIRDIKVDSVAKPVDSGTFVLESPERIKPQTMGSSA